MTDAPPRPRSLAALRRAAEECRRCDLYRISPEPVMGEGPLSARLLLVGEQPGDREDRAGAPFVGPAGMLLDRALVAAGVDRDEVFVTNAVKRFRWRQQGKRRIHQKPTTEQVRACRVWLDTELRLVAPEVVVALGATAAQSLLGAHFRISRHRGQFYRPPGLPLVMATAHPASVVRLADRPERHEAFDQLVADLRRAGRAVEQVPAQTSSLPTRSTHA